ncbi:MAG: histidine phosphatase family protein [Pseudonocardiaceae bacterium]
MAEVVLIRHGETAWSRTGQHTGVSDISLTTAGERQAQSLGTALVGRRFGLVLSSPRQRARRTAELSGLTGIEIDGNLAEWDYGGYEGQTTADISAALGRPWSVWDDGVCPGATPGETLNQVAGRAAAVLKRIHPVLGADDDVLLVAHGHVLRVLAAVWLGLPPVAGALLALSAGSLSTLGFEHSRPVLTSWNTHSMQVSPAGPPLTIRRSSHQE